MNTTTAATCTACKSLPGNMQCNHHRSTAPNAATALQSQMVAHMRETGSTAAEAEAHFGVSAGITVR